MSSKGSEGIETSGNQSLHRTFTLDEFRKKTGRLIIEAMKNNARALLRAECAGGKTYGSFKYPSNTNKNTAHLMPRRDLYDEGERLAEKFGESSVILRTPENDCGCFDPESPLFNQKAKNLKNICGLSGTEIHSKLDMACGNACDYMQQQETFDPDNYDVIIGHYKHAYRRSIQQGRFGFIDEFPGSAFTMTVENPGEHITPFLQDHDSILYDDYSELKDNRHNVSGIHMEKRNSLHDWLQSNGPSVEPDEIINNHPKRRYHRNAPYLAYVVQNLVDLGNGFEIPEWQSLGTPCRFSNGRKSVFQRGDGSGCLSLLTPPDLSDFDGILGLDATPTPSMWNLVLGENLDRREVLKSNEERENYLRNTLGITVKQTNTALKSYNGGNISYPRDTGILYGGTLEHGEKPGVIVTQRGERKFDENGVLDHADGSLHYGEVRSSGKFEDKALGAVMSSNHPGNDIIKKWGALMGDTITSEGTGMNRDYGTLGNRIKSHFLEHQVEQAICRFGRSEDIEETTVFVNTGAITDYIPVSGRIPKNSVRFDTDNRRAIADCLRDAEGGESIKSLIEATGASENTVRNFLNGETKDDDGLIDWGLVESVDKPGPYPMMYEWVHEND